MLDDEGFNRALRPAEVRSLAEHMGGLSAAELRRRYDPARMRKLKIYPEGWTDAAEGGDAARDRLLACFDDVRDFMAKAAAAADGVVVQIS